MPLGAARKMGMPYGPRVLARYDDFSFNQGISAEMIADKWALTREELDAFSVESHAKAAAAIDAGAFDGQIVPVDVEGRRFAEDEGVRRNTSVERLAKSRHCEVGRLRGWWAHARSRPDRSELGQPLLPRLLIGGESHRLGRWRVNRRMPRWSELQPLLRPPSPGPDAPPRRLSRAASIPDLRAIARRRVPRAVFDYVDGAAESETSLARARSAFARVEFRPRVLRDVSKVDASATILGTDASFPLIFGPTGFTRMMHHEGEPAVARAASRLGIPYALSTMGTTAPEDLAAAAPDGDNWFQLYMSRDRDAALDLVRRAASSGFPVLMLTVDTAVAGARLRDVRNGLTMPPTLSPRTALNMARHPAWLFNLLTTEPLAFASFGSSSGPLADLVEELLDPALSFDDLTVLRETWTGRLVVKGVQTVEDARRVVDLGADAVVLSNHGGRQLDKAPTPLELLPETVEAIGDRAEVYIDSGVLSGSDVVAAVALGAKAVLVGRAYLYGLMAGGQKGVEHAGQILRNDIIRTMRLLGVNSLDELGPEHARLRPGP